MCVCTDECVAAGHMGGAAILCVLVVRRSGTCTLNLDLMIFRVHLGWVKGQHFPNTKHFNLLLVALY